MNKAHLAEAVAKKLGSSHKAGGEAVDAVLSAISDAVANGETVTIIGFGVFDSIDRPARTGRNPHTGESLDIAATTAPRFKAAKAFKDAVKS